MVRDMLRQYFEPVHDVLAGVQVDDSGRVVAGDAKLIISELDLIAAKRAAAMIRRKTKKSRAPKLIHPAWFFPGTGANRTTNAINIVAAKGTTTNNNSNTKHYSTSNTVRSFDNGLYNFERIVDDFVFLSFFVGNDFIPAIPHIDIADGCMHMLMTIYQTLLPRLGGYVTDRTAVHLPRLEMIIAEFARREPLYFEQRATDDYVPEYATDEYKEHYYKVQ